MSIIDKANEYIGYPKEMDESYTTSVRREAYAQGFKDALKLVVEMRNARNKYSSLSREFCSKGMKPRQSWEWQEARKLTKKLEAEMDILLKDLRNDNLY